MFKKIKKLSDDQFFLIGFYILSVLVSFLFGYLVFRYWQIEVCKSPMKVVYLQVIPQKNQLSLRYAEGMVFHELELT